MANEARRIALGGMLAALAVVLMAMGGMIPVATYAVPMLCMLLLKLVLSLCGRRVAWAWYGAVAILGLLFCPDKEAAAVYAALGYYPILKSAFDARKLGWAWKLMWFNAVILALYALLLHLFGLSQLVEDFEGMGIAMTAALLILGNLVFFLLDRVLGRSFGRLKGS